MDPSDFKIKKKNLPIQLTHLPLGVALIEKREEWEPPLNFFGGGEKLGNI
jgi:hypothetical protein